MKMSNAREKYMLALANLINGSELGYEDRSSIPQYKKDIEDYVDSLEKVNKEYKEVIDKVSSQIKLYGKYNGEKCTRGFSVMTADFNKLLDILKEVE